MSNKLKFIKAWIIIAPIIATLDMICWTLQFSNEDAFYNLDAYLGALPNFMDNIFPSVVEIQGSDVTMGYVYTAGLLVALTIAAMQYEKRLVKTEEDKKEEKIKVKTEEIFTITEVPTEEPRIPLEKVNHFYGLLELKLEYFNPVNKSVDDLDKLKKEYLRMIVEKLKNKFEQVKFSVSDKIFLYSDEFSVFNGLSDDLVTLYKIFYDLDYDKGIKTDLLLSFWTDVKKVDMKKGLNVLTRINNLQYWNKVVVSDVFSFKYDEETEKIYDLIPLGPSRLDMEDENGRDIEMDMFYLKKK